LVDDVAGTPTPPPLSDVDCVRKLVSSPAHYLETPREVAA
jgi:hypothetical protein